MNFTQLSERLQASAAWSINAVGIRRIESGERRVSPDDLVALSIALGVSPITLLYPNAKNADDNVVVTGLPIGEDARVVWEWFTASQWGYWAMERRGNFDRPSTFYRNSWPQWLLDSHDQSWLDFMDDTWESTRNKARQQLLDGEAPNGES